MMICTCLILVCHSTIDCTEILQELRLLLCSCCPNLIVRYAFALRLRKVKLLCFLSNHITSIFAFARSSIKVKGNGNFMVKDILENGKLKICLGQPKVFV